MSGIYKITNKINGKVYIGRTNRSFEIRWAEHIKQLNNNNHVNTGLQKDWNTHKVDNFEFSVLENVAHLNETPLKEYLHISKCSKDNCYNKIYRKAHNNLKAIDLLLKDDTLKVYLECIVEGINWSMVVKDLKHNKVHYFVQNLTNKKNIRQRVDFINNSINRVLIDISKPIRNYHDESNVLYNLLKRGDVNATIIQG